MTAATEFLQHVSAIGFALVGLVAVVQWYRQRDRQGAYLALALGLFGLVSLTGEIERDVGLTRPDGTSSAPPIIAAILGLVGLGLFMGCAYALLLFRHQLLPVRRQILRAVAVVMVVTGLPLVPLTFDPAFAKQNPGLVLALIIPLFVVWCLAIGEPVYRMWRVSGTRPAVQRGRLRALAAGYGLIIVVLVLAIGVASVSPGQRLEPASPVALAEQLVILLAVPILYVSFAPPRWLRRSWRAAEEEAFNEALHDLLLGSPNTSALAERGLSWATRLVGAEGGVMINPDGTILASRGVNDLAIAESQPASTPGRAGAPGRLPGGEHTMTVPLTLGEGTGRMVVVAGSLTPAMGGEESVRLSQYAVSVGAAIDRMRLVEAVRKSEEELRTANRELEERVRSRTAELEVSNLELQASNQELEAFSYTVAHDLRSPLRAIDGFTRILSQEHAASLEPAAQRYLGLVAENARGMGSLIDTMLTFSRMGRQPLSLQRVDPTEVARRVAERVLADTDDRVIHIDVQPMPECDSDLVLLEQVFGNLIGNAVKFTRQRAETQITVASMPDPQASDVTAYFVRDNGVGFDPRYAHKLFALFQRLHRAEEYEGFGAGLAIVERIVTRHGGRVWAESTPGEGAAFYFTLKPATGSRRLR